MCEVLRNKHYQDDIKTSLQITRDFLLAVGIWPIEKRSLCEKIDRYLRILVSYIFLYCALVPGALYWMIEKRTRVRLRSTTILLYGFITIIKYYNLITHEAQIRRCLKFFEEDWKSVDNTAARNIMLESASIGKRMVTICAIFMYSSGLSLRILIPLSKGKIVTPQNVTIRPLPYPTYLFSFDVQPTPIYEIVFTMHVFTGIITVSISMCIYSLMIVFIMHICGQLKILINLIKDLAEKQQRDELEVNKKLGAIVEHQTRTRSFLQLVESTLQSMLFIEILALTVIVGLISYCILMEWENSNLLAMCSYFIILFTMIVDMFIFCYAGEQIITQAEKVTITSCELEWYRLPCKKARGIILVMIISNMGMKITAGKLIVLSFKTFSDLIKTAATYLNVLRTVTD